MDSDSIQQAADVWASFFGYMPRHCNQSNFELLINYKVKQYGRSFLIKEENIQTLLIRSWS